MKRVVMYSSATCGPCKQIKPVLTEIAKARGIHLEIVEMSLEDADMFKEMKIRAVPTILALNDNKETGRIVGALTPAALTEKLDNWDFK